MEVVPGPDFPTGGIICGRDGIIDGYKTGRGRITLRASIKVEEPKGGKPIVVIDELPYGVIRKTIVESVANCVKNGVINDISDVNDHSGREHKVRIVIDLKRDADPNVIVNQLFQYTPCQITVSMINIALVNRQPRTMGLKELIQHFIEHRREVITRRTRVPAPQGAAARAYPGRVDLRRLRHRRSRPADPLQQDAGRGHPEIAGAGVPDRHPRQSGPQRRTGAREVPELRRGCLRGHARPGPPAAADAGAGRGDRPAAAHSARRARAGKARR